MSVRKMLPLYAIALFIFLKFAILTEFLYFAFGSVSYVPFVQFRSDLVLLSLLVVASVYSHYLHRSIAAAVQGIEYLLFALMVLDLLLQLSIGHRFLMYEALSLDNGTGIEDFGYLFAIFIATVVFLTGGAYAMARLWLPSTAALIVLFISVLAAGIFYPSKAVASTSGSNVLFQNLDWRFAAPSDAAPDVYATGFVDAGMSDRRPDVIVVLAESFSASDSHAVSGLPGVLPHFDALAKKGRLYTNMIAEGASTDRAYIALIGGVPGFPHDASPHRYVPYTRTPGTIAKAFGDAGYHTVFEKSYTLDFLHLRDYLASAGFDEVYGKDERFGQNDAFVFGAQPDNVIYDDILARLNVHEGTRPLFLMATTVSTHLPYSAPGAKTYEEVYRFADQELGRFASDLESSGYFEHGILIVTGDHRRMGMLSPNEFERYGESAYARVAALAVGVGIMPGHIDNGLYTLSDIHHSLKTLIGKGSVRRDYNDIFCGTQARNFALHNLGGNPANYLRITQFSSAFFTVDDAKGQYDSHRMLQQIRGYFDTSTR